jgi:hypothetical protein
MNFFHAPPLDGFYKTLQSGFACRLPQRGNLQHFPVNSARELRFSPAFGGGETCFVSQAEMEVL